MSEADAESDSEAKCRMCGYDLSGLAETGVCPECGTRYKAGYLSVDPCYFDACNAGFCGIGSLVLFWIPPIALTFALCSVLYERIVVHRRNAGRGGWASQRAILVARCTGWPGLALSVALLPACLRSL